jgi:hypothetical protein
VMAMLEQTSCSHYRFNGVLSGEHVVELTESGATSQSIQNAHT